MNITSILTFKFLFLFLFLFISLFIWKILKEQCVHENVVLYNLRKYQIWLYCFSTLICPLILLPFNLFKFTIPNKLYLLPYTIAIICLFWRKIYLIWKNIYLAQRYFIWIKQILKVLYLILAPIRAETFD